MSMQHLQEGLDPTPLACITKSDLLQMIRNAKPYPQQGFIIFADSAPDVVTNPELEYFLWMKTVAGVPNKEVYYYNGTSWELLPLIDGAYIANYTISLTKLKLTGSSPFDLIHVNIAGTDLEWVSPPNAIQANTLGPEKLIAPDNVNKYMLVCLLGFKEFKLIDTVLSVDVSDNVIPVMKLVRAGADSLKKFLSTNAAGTTIEWTNVDVANLAAAGSAAGQGIRRNIGNTAWEYYDVSTSSTPYGPTACPNINGAAVTYAHGLARAARVFRFALRCTDAGGDAGYAQNDEVDINSFKAFTVDGEISFSAFSVWTDVTNIGMRPHNSDGRPDDYIGVPNKTTGINTAITVAKWNVVAYVQD